MSLIKVNLTNLSNIFATLFLLLSTAVYCSADETTSGNLEPLDGKIRIDICEDIYDGKSFLVLKMESEKLFANNEYSIVESYTTEGKHDLVFNITIVGVQPETTLVKIPTPATYSTYMMLLNKKYRKNVTSNGVSDYYYLEVADDYFHLIPSPDGDLLIAEDTKIWRTPKKSFALINSHRESDSDRIFEEFLNLMNQKVSLNELTFSKEGIAPFGKSGKEMSVKCFKYRSKRDLNKIRTLVNKAHQSIIIPENVKLDIHIKIWDGEIIQLF